MGTPTAYAILAAGLLMASVPAHATVKCDVSQEALEVLKLKFQDLRDKYDADLNLIVGLGTNPADRRLREKLFNDWGGANGRENRRVEIKDFADSLTSTMGHCAP